MQAAFERPMGEDNLVEAYSAVPDLIDDPHKPIPCTGE
jgi:hypothetical protein